MTYRELELFIEGQTEFRTWFLESLAWTQANLMNVHVPRGKPKITADQLLPKKRRQKQSDEEAAKQSLAEEFAPLDNTGDNPQARLAATKARARAKSEQKEYESFRRSKEGKRIAEILGEE